MALIPSTLLFNSKKYGVGNEAFGGIVFDLLLDEKHSFKSNVTAHSVEDGSVIADHIFNALRTGSIRGLVTNYSISAGPLALAANLLAGEGMVANRAKDAYEFFKKLWKAKIPVTIVTQLEVYDNVVVTSVETEKDAESGSALRFSVNFQQIVTVKLKETYIDAGISITDMSTTFNQQAALKLDAGRQAAEDLSISKGQDFSLQLLLGGL